VRTASTADPDGIAGGEPAGDGTLSTRSLDTRASSRDVVRVAKRHLGTPYKAGGPRVCRAFRREDCSCHTRPVYKRFDRKLPDSPVRQWRMQLGNRIGKSQLRPGDLVFNDLNRDRDQNDHFWDHVSIYVGNGKIIHTSSWCGKVCITEMRYLDNYWGAKRVGNG
jgi:cell wall-associated NlpC family hydrolase